MPEAITDNKLALGGPSAPANPGVCAAPPCCCYTCRVIPREKEKTLAVRQRLLLIFCLLQVFAHSALSLEYWAEATQEEFEEALAPFLGQ